MADLKFEDFLVTVDAKNRGDAMEINEALLGQGCTCKIEEAKSGFTVSYLLAAEKRTVATFICRKTGTKLRIYPKHLGNYEVFLGTLPESLKKEIKKASVCKRLLNPADCNPKCVMGYAFTMDGEAYQKCRYSAFQLTLSPENNPFIQQLLQKEMQE